MTNSKTRLKFPLVPMAVHLELMSDSPVERRLTLTSPQLWKERTRPMAKKKRGGVNRTEKVHEYLLAHPDQSTNEVLAGLAEQGVKVSSSLVSQGRAKLGLSPGRGRKKAAKKKGAKKKATGASMAARSTTSAATSAKITADELYDAKQLADQLGGVQRLRDALDALERLR
jgi:hypothetical protein